MKKDLELIGNLPLRYDPTTGEFFFTCSVGSRKRGQKAGTLTKEGYWSVKINKSSYRLHRLAFVLMGVPIPPELDVDHIDRDKSNNRWDNLRVVTHKENSKNTPARKTNILGCKHIRKLCQKYQVRIDGKSLGVYKTLKEAQDVIREVDETGWKKMETPGITLPQMKRLLLLAKHGGRDHKRWYAEYCQLSRMGLISWCLGTAFISDKGDKLLEELVGK